MSGTFWETKITLDGRTWRFPCQRVAVLPDLEAVVLFETPREWRVERPAIVVPAGSYSYGYFWRDRHINAYHWLSRDGASIGVYFNVAADTRITAGEVVWRDLVLDYWVGADGVTAFLDEDEVPDDIAPPIDHVIRTTRAFLTREGSRLARELTQRSEAYWSGRAAARPAEAQGGRDPASPI